MHIRGKKNGVMIEKRKPRIGSDNRLCNFRFPLILALQSYNYIATILDRFPHHSNNFVCILTLLNHTHIWSLHVPIRSIFCNVNWVDSVDWWKIWGGWGLRIHEGANISVQFAQCFCPNCSRSRLPRVRAVPQACWGGCLRVWSLWLLRSAITY